VHGKKWYETELQCIMYIVFATYLSADPRTTLKALNSLTSPTKDQPNLGKPNEMLSFRSVESTTSTFTDRYTNRKVAAASLYFCRKPGTITSITTRMVPSTYALHRAGNLAPSLLPSLPCVSLVLFLSPAVLYIFPIAAKRQKREKKRPRKKVRARKKKTW
jgi:hypothetical protein